MSNKKYATLCLLLITYHWHASWAVSARPSGGRLAVGIAAEVNGSSRPPTDAPLNIPVVKRSSNQGYLANELPARCPPPGSLLRDEKLHTELLELLHSTDQRIPSSDRFANDLEPMITRIFQGTDEMTEDSTMTDVSENNEGRSDTEMEFRSLEDARKINAGIGATTHGTRIFDVRGIEDMDRSVSSRMRRETRRIDSVKARPGGKRVERTTDYERTRGNVPSNVSSSEFSENVSSRRNKASSGITSFLDVTKLLDHSRLHQQSRNTKPRTIVQHLRSSDVAGRMMMPRRTYRDSSQLSRRISGPMRTNQASNQLRFVPYYNYYRNKNLKAQGDDSINEIVAFADNAQFSAPRNITDLSSFERQIDDLSKSLSDVLNRQLATGQREQFPNVRTILPKEIFIAPPRIIEDAKILPAPFSLNKYFEDSGNFGEGITGVQKNIGFPLRMIDGVFDSGKINGNFDKRPAIPVRENSNEPVITRTENANVSNGLHNSGILVGRVPPLSPENRARNPAMMEKPSSRVQEASLQRPKARVKQGNSSKTEKILSSENVRSSYDDSTITSDQNASRNVDHSGNVIVVASDHEYANQRSTTRDQHPLHRLPAGGRSFQPAGARDKNYDRNGNKWRGNDENDRTRYIAKYSFGYLVNDQDSRNDFGHHEMRDEGITKGRYHVKLPDGRIQKVNYQVDENGYHAVVSYQRDQLR